MAEYQVGIDYGKEFEEKTRKIAGFLEDAKEFINRAEKQEIAEDMVREIIRAGESIKHAVDLTKELKYKKVKQLMKKVI